MAEVFMSLPPWGFGTALFVFISERGNKIVAKFCWIREPRCSIKPLQSVAIFCHAKGLHFRYNLDLMSKKYLVNEVEGSCFLKPKISEIFPDIYISPDKYQNMCKKNVPGQF